MRDGGELTADDEGHDEDRHEAALGVVHVVAVPQPLLRLAADLSVHAVPPPRRDQGAGGVEVIAQVLGHEAALGQYDGLGIGARRRDGDDGRLAKRMDLLQFRGCQHRLLVAVEEDDVVGDVELFEEPDDALGARVVEPARL